MEWPVWCNPWMERALKKLLAENLVKIKKHKNLTEGKIAKDGKIGTGGAHRALIGQNVTLETIEGLVKATGMPAWQLLFPGLDPSKPPLLTAAAIEAEVNRRVRVKWAGIKGQMDDLRVTDEEDGRPTPAEPFIDRPRPPEADAARAARGKAKASKA